MAGGPEGALAKVARARALTEGFLTACDEWCSAQELEIREHVEDGWLIWSALPFEATPPVELALRLGEIVYDLRSALDHLAWSFVEVNGKSPNRRTMFPVAITASAWSNACAKDLRGIQASVVDAIRQWQPFVRSAAQPRIDTLAAINEIGNVDKHRTLLLTTTALFGGNFAMTLPAGDHEILRRNLRNGLPLDVEQDIARLNLAGLSGKVPELDRAASTLTASLQVSTFDPDRFVFPYIYVPKFVDHVAAIVDDLATHF